MIVKDVLKDINNIVLDTGVIVEYFTEGESNLKEYLKETFFNKNSSIKLYGHHLLKTEIYYIICRALGQKEAKNKIIVVEKFINFLNGNYLFEIAGQLKCKYSISLSDCFSIASGLFVDCPTLFLKEKELSEEIVEKINKEFNSKIYLI